MSREHELLTGSKRDTQLTFDESGVLKLQKSSHVEPCNTGGEIQVKYEQANLVKFALMEAWSEKMMQSKLEEPSSGFARTTMNNLNKLTENCLSFWVKTHERESKRRPMDVQLMPSLKNACSLQRFCHCCSLDLSQPESQKGRHPNLPLRDL